jgi:hypothetical protein
MGLRREVDASRVYSEGEDEETLLPAYGQVFDQIQTTIRRSSGRTSSLAGNSIPTSVFSYDSHLGLPGVAQPCARDWQVSHK